MLRKIYEVLAARMRKLTTARARKNKRTAHMLVNARMLANTRKNHSIPLYFINVFRPRELSISGKTQRFSMINPLDRPVINTNLLAVVVPYSWWNLIDMEFW